MYFGRAPTAETNNHMFVIDLMYHIITSPLATYKSISESSELSSILTQILAIYYTVALWRVLYNHSVTATSSQVFQANELSHKDEYLCNSIDLKISHHHS